MASTLVATQFGIPPDREQLLRRDRLIAALEQDVVRAKLTLVSAPAGCGKTTLLAQWAHASQLPIAWLSLGAQENDLDRWLRCLLTAWEAVQPGVAASPLGVLLGTMAPDLDTVLTSFINLAQDVPEDTVFVLDDYHVIVDARIHQTLTYHVDHLPPRLHIVLAGRGNPPLPVARYRARQELLEVDAGELRFLPEETATFLNDLMGMNLTDDQIESAQKQLEGWVAGLQLLALSRRRHLAPAKTFVASGRHRFIADYLSEDVLAQQPDDMRSFLLQTSILDRMTGALCDAVTVRDDSHAMLERLERDQLFLVALDDTREWYRYHRIFADALQDQLRRRHKDEVVDLHRRAARWLLAHDFPEAAFAQAMAGDDPECVLQLFERFVFVKRSPRYPCGVRVSR